MGASDSLCVTPSRCPDLPSARTDVYGPRFVHDSCSILPAAEALRSISPVYRFLGGRKRGLGSEIGGLTLQEVLDIASPVVKSWNLLPPHKDK